MIALFEARGGEVDDPDEALLFAQGTRGVVEVVEGTALFKDIDAVVKLFEGIGFLCEQRDTTNGPMLTVCGLLDVANDVRYSAELWHRDPEVGPNEFFLFTSPSKAPQTKCHLVDPVIVEHLDHLFGRIEVKRGNSGCEVRRGHFDVGPWTTTSSSSSGSEGP